MIQVLLLIPIIIFSTEYGLIKGIVKDDNNEPVVGANVVIEGTNIGDCTNENGIFTLCYVTIGAHILKVSSLQYETRKISVSVKPGETTFVNIPSP